MKRLLSTALALILALSLTACGGSKADEAPAPSKSMRGLADHTASPLSQPRNLCFGGVP